jgi:hypothetical protein
MKSAELNTYHFRNRRGKFFEKIQVRRQQRKKEKVAKMKRERKGTRQY